MCTHMGEVKTFLFLTLIGRYGTVASLAVKIMHAITVNRYRIQYISQNLDIAPKILRGGGCQNTF
jgi:hypothetical protein